MSDLSLLSLSALSREIGMDRSTVSRMVRAGVIPVALRDEPSPRFPQGRPWFTLATYRAAMERAGVLHAEKGKGAA